MLTHITISNFTLVEQLDLNLKQGMTTITGETGTGKSIILDALAMALGERADGDRVRHGADKADITVTFSLDDLPEARDWLIKHELSHENDCLLRRIITREGRSRSFINAQPVTLQQVRVLGDLLIDIHSQHAHQSLLLKTTHQRLLDEFARHLPLVHTVAAHYNQWQSLQKKWVSLRDNADDMQARYTLLRYQIEELEQLDPVKGELQPLEEEQKTLSNAEMIISKSHQLAENCDHESHGLQQRLQQTLNILSDMVPQSPSLCNIRQLLNSALIHVEEASIAIRNQIETIEPNPERLHEVNERLSACYDMARKHHVQPEELPDKQQQLQQELTAISSSEDTLVALAKQVQTAKETYLDNARQLSQQRQAAATQFTQRVNEQLNTLGMQNADFSLSLTSNESTPSIRGIDTMEFLIRTNPGHPHKPLSKVASGGELSRISLAIQVIAAQTSHIATLVFDEVDVGIGGATADIVGKTLYGLGKNCQVLCITHLAQVASKAHQHWQVSKFIHGDNTHSTITELTGQDKVEEIARMISGSEKSSEALAHARLMLGVAV